MKNKKESVRERKSNNKVYDGNDKRMKIMLHTPKWNILMRITAVPSSSYMTERETEANRTLSREFSALVCMFNKIK